MDGPAKSQIRRKPVAGSQPLPVRSPAPDLPGHRGDLREYTVNQLSVQTTGLMINTTAENYEETRRAPAHRIQTPQSEKSPAWTSQPGLTDVQGSSSQYGARSVGLNTKPLPTVPNDKPLEDRPPLPPRIRTPQPEGSGKGKSPMPNPQRSPSFGPLVTSSSTLAPSDNPPPYSLINPHLPSTSATQTLRPPAPPSPSPSSASSRPTTPTPTTPSTSTSTSKWTSALSKTQDLALSILPQNYTTTKHHTVLLHGTPLIVYRGPTTSLSITIFSAPKYPLPPPHQRVLYLQPRGFSGDTGTKLKTLMRTYDDWINVTPAHRADIQDVDAAVVKRWEKDIARTQKRLSKTFKPEKCHVVRETHVIRIPAVAEDGYFRVVVCHKEEGQKRKPICSGPLARIASLSTDSSVFRGAKLRTLPLEAGLSVASMMATGYVNTVAGPAVQTVQSKIDQIRPGFVAQTVYDTALADTVDEQEQAMREATYAAYQTENGRGVDVIGSDEGPEKPFPVRFSGKVVQGTGRGSERLGIPTANLGDVAENIRNHLKGVYFGWASIRDTNGVEQDWHESIIFVGPSPFAPPSVVAKNTIAVHMLHNFEGEAHFYGAKMQVVVMGFLRPMHLPGTPVEQMLDAISQDLWLTMASLGRDNWGPHAVTERVKALPVTTRTMSGLSERMLATKERVQTKIDRIPAHLIGVRTTGAELRDALHGNGGYWVAR